MDFNFILEIEKNTVKHKEGKNDHPHIAPVLTALLLH
jgi:hypothetical protein